MTKNNIVAAIIAVLTGIVILGVVVLCTVGWIKNAVKLVQADFQAPYKNEIVRAIGIPVGPFGVVMGYVHIED